MERENFTWDVFISYRRVTPDKEWVEEQLVPALDRTGLRVWLDKRNCGPGNIYPATEKVIAESRQAICVVSPPYMKKIRKKGGLLFLEFRKLLDSNTADEYQRLIPLLLGDGKVPEKIDELAAIDWTDPDTHRQEWKKLLRFLRVENTEASEFPPGVVKLYYLKLHYYFLKLCVKRALPAACVLLVIVVLGWWLTSSEGAARQDEQPSPVPTLQLVTQTPPPTPTPTPYRDPSRLPRATIRTGGGKVVARDMSVPPSAVVAGVVEGEVAPGLRVFVYVQRKGGDYDDLWLCAGTAVPDGKTWSFGRVAFRLPKFEGEMKTTVLTLLRSQQVCGEFKDSELSAVMES